jgi:hypothetical protein
MSDSTSVCAASPDFTLRVVRGSAIVEVPATAAKTGGDIVVSITATVESPNPQHK